MDALVRSLVGRQREQEALSSFVTASSGQSLVLRGEIGAGKSALLDHVADLACQEGHQVVRAVGVEAESDYPFAGLHQFLYPLMSHLDRLDASHRAVFDVVFSRNQGAPPSVMTLAIAVLDLLSLASSQKPLLLVLDDGQWFDTVSAEVCGFAGRRLAGSSVKLVVGVRSDVPSHFDTAALPELHITTLSEDDSQTLLDLHHPRLDPKIRRIVLDEAQGNPLALLELPPFLSGRPGRCVEELPGYHGVPLPRRLEYVYGTRIEALDKAVRAELLRGALDGAGSGMAAGAARGTRYRMVDVDAAALSGLLDVDRTNGHFVFRHPLVRSTVVQKATPNERRDAHAALARVYRDDLERRATHLAASTIDPDEEVAAELEAAAKSATRRGGALAAITWLTRAAELSESSEDRSRRLGDAAFIAGQAALPDQAQRLVHSDTAPDGGASPASVAASAYDALYRHGEVRSSRRQVTAALEAVRDDRTCQGMGEAEARLVILLIVTCQYASDAVAWQQARELLDALGDRIPAQSLLYRDAWSDVVRHGAGLRQRVDRAFAEARHLNPWDLVRLGVTAYHLDVLGPHRSHLQRTVDREAETGAIAAAMSMLHLITLDQMATGEWEEAERTCARSLELASEHDHALFAYHSRAYLAQLAALRGQVERARELQAAVDAWARPRGVGFLTQIADAVGITAALSEGDYESAYLYAIGITAPGSFEPYAHQASRTLLDLVEAAVHAGRADEARRHALAARHAGLPDVSPRLALITHGALAMTAEGDEEAAAHYEQAESVAEGDGFPFELARIRLAQGIRVRHSQGPKAARQALLRAAESFERLGAAAWADRARAELRASGMSTRPSSTSALTWQEHRIAGLAASGLTNKEIGERMHLSPRTVSSHLYRVFPKLGITTRAALRDALGNSTEENRG
ncbi:helix-turn-helix transcriptional regulator [Kitasatospora cathayae]|uniref:LuxR family transcriptional regulator n=1 Tax=Kitasatospora cathayae TaxID=3004092 RepID=A0ABY7Q0X7_9ACTN|nr:LuxR family transcriptional regulator [Kitasatospora sp. HUAS 3-15]WBP86276.1 LuxR family transcriptional regulator [Kitasatospora sp. HUAS 3-15]